MWSFGMSFGIREPRQRPCGRASLAPAETGDARSHSTHAHTVPYTVVVDRFRYSTLYGHWMSEISDVWILKLFYAGPAYRTALG